MNKMLYVGTCGVCQTGNIGIRISASGRCAVGLCDECDSVWLDVTLRDGPYTPPQPDLPCPGDGSSLKNSPAHWADLAEAQKVGWSEAVLGESSALYR